MKHFGDLFEALDQTTKTNEKVAALEHWFRTADEADRLWGIALLSHRRPRRTVTTTQLRQWAAEVAGVPEWLFEESYHVVGDLAETIALLLPPPSESSGQSLAFWIRHLQSIGALEEDDKRSAITEAWNQMEARERFLFNKLITGGFRIGVSQKLMVRALSKATGVGENELAHRLMGNWEPGSTTFEALVFAENPTEDASRPYPFYLAYPLEDAPESLGNIADWQAEYKWDGIRGQVIVRKGEVFVWSRGEELVTDKFPEYNILADLLPDGTVLDGEILTWKDGAPLPFQTLQTRIGRKNVGKATLEKAPVILMAYDLLEWRCEDVRDKPLAWRRNILEQLMEEVGENAVLRLSPTVVVEDWEALARARMDARDLQTEGLMLKRKDSPYESGRKRGSWWKWKVSPLTVDAVMIYAQRGHGRRANLYTDYTFAVWDGDVLVPFAKAYSGLTDAEIREVDRFIKANTLERFGPVRSVKAELVFEIAFEGIQASPRHKSGIALRFPRIARWRKDKPAGEAGRIEDLRGLI